jgi:hypothetical protein
MGLMQLGLARGHLGRYFFCMSQIVSPKDQHTRANKYWLHTKHTFMAGTRGSRKKSAEESEASKKAPANPPKVKTKRKAGTKEDPPAKKNKHAEGMCSICVFGV